MALQFDFGCTVSLVPQDFDRFASLINEEWINEALAQTGTVSLRRRRLPAERMIWLVIGLALFRNESMAKIVHQLDLADGPSSKIPVPSAVVAGRERLGEEPLAWLFDRSASTWGSDALPPTALFHGLRSFAVDGVVLSLPDTPENAQEFGRPKGLHGEGGWPQLRAACLMDTFTHLIRAANFDGYHKGELSLAKPLAQAAPDDSLTIFDRGFFCAPFLLDWQQSGQHKHWLIRTKTNLRYDVVYEAAPGDYWVRLPISSQARTADPGLPTHWEARLIECKIGGHPRRFLTSLQDARRFPAQEIAAHYIQRWEIELGFREIKQGMLKKAPTLRSKLPSLVKQEMWGTLIAYNLLRHEIAGMAADLHVPPLRLSFQWLCVVIATALYHWPLDTPGTFPKRLALLREQAQAFLLPARRSRSCPRAVKSRKSKYPTRSTVTA